MQDIWDESASVPFWGKAEQLQKLSEVVGHCVNTVTASQSVREMVLETWLAVDYAVRDLLLGGYQLARFCQEDFDLRYLLLPQSFERLLHLLKETVSFQCRLGPETPPPSSDQPPYIHSSRGFLKYLAERHPETRQRLKDIELEYLAIRDPDLAKHIQSGGGFCHIPKKEAIERLASGWMAVAASLGDDWFRSATRLNKARNKAAHSYDASAIAMALGKSGPEVCDMVRGECLELLKILLGTSRG